MSENFFYKQDTLPHLTKEMAPPLPQQIGPYKIESMLSRGGMSFLYLGLHPETSKLVAVKILSPSFATDETATERFLKEAHIISLSNHPNIVKLYGEGKWEQGLYIAMEWIRGISLRQFITQQSLSLRRALDIILQVAYALHHLHSHGIIHRDLKPENILITEEGGVKVIDFGISQINNDKGAASKIRQGIMGTPNYMSPEQKEDASKARFASDIYSLGIISYELILGKLSFGQLQLGLMPKGLKKIIEKALAPSLDDRYKNITDFINDISQYLTSGDIERERPGTDQIKEAIETFQKVSQSICNFSGSEWPEIELGIAKYPMATQFGLYVDKTHLDNGSFLFLIAESCASGLESIAYVAGMRGYIKALIHEMGERTKGSWDLAQFSIKLNELMMKDSAKQTYAFAALLLDPYQEKLCYFNAGLNHLLHISSEGSPRILASSNALIQSELAPTYTQVEDNWNVGDTVIFHSLSPSHRAEPYQQKQTEKILLEALQEDAFLSAQPQAEALMKKAMLLSFQREQKQSRVLLSIQRIA